MQIVELSIVIQAEPQTRIPEHGVSKSQLTTVEVRPIKTLIKSVTGENNYTRYARMHLEYWTLVICIEIWLHLLPSH